MLQEGVPGVVGDDYQQEKNTPAVDVLYEAVYYICAVIAPSEISTPLQMKCAVAHRLLQSEGNNTG